MRRANILNGIMWGACLALMATATVAHAQEPATESRTEIVGMPEKEFPITMTFNYTDGQETRTYRENGEYAEPLNRELGELRSITVAGTEIPVGGEGPVMLSECTPNLHIWFEGGTCHVRFGF